MPGEQTISLFCCLLGNGSLVKSMKTPHLISLGMLAELQAIDSKFSTLFLQKSTDEGCYQIHLAGMSPLHVHIFLFLILLEFQLCTVDFWRFLWFQMSAVVGIKPSVLAHDPKRASLTAS